MPISARCRSIERLPTPAIDGAPYGYTLAASPFSLDMIASTRGAASTNSPLQQRHTLLVLNFESTRLSYLKCIPWRITYRLTKEILVCDERFAKVK